MNKKKNYVLKVGITGNPVVVMVLVTRSASDIEVQTMLPTE